MREMTLTDIERLQAQAGDADVPLELDEEMFGAFYERTSRALWAYLSRMTRDPHQADDLLQESYYRFLRARGTYESEAHRRHSLFRIATNLMRDGHRRSRHMPTTSIEGGQEPMAPRTGADAARQSDARTDLNRAMADLKPRERALLWLAYAQGSSHREIATVLGLRTGSIKLLLFRARRKLAVRLRGPEKAERHDL
jgi:RNA polymerase sigma-70 factor (ECF subfamily)